MIGKSDNNNNLVVISPFCFRFNKHQQIVYLKLKNYHMNDKGNIIFSENLTIKRYCDKYKKKEISKPKERLFNNKIKKY